MWQRSMTCVWGWISDTEAGCLRTTGPASIPTDTGQRSEDKAGRWQDSRHGPSALAASMGIWQAEAPDLKKCQKWGREQ